jgi:hypothetical protein
MQWRKHKSLWGTEPTSFQLIAHPLHWLSYIFMARQPSWAKAFSSLSFRYYNQTHYTRNDSSRWMRGPSQRNLPDSAQHSQETDIYAPSEIQTRNRRKRVTRDPRLRLRGHWDRPCYIYYPPVPKCIRVTNSRRRGEWIGCAVNTVFWFVHSCSAPPQSSSTVMCVSP